MESAGKRLFASSVICYLVGFGALLLVSIFSFSLQTVLASFHWDWVMTRTWAEFLRLAPIAQAWAALLTFGWVLPMQLPETASIDFSRFNKAIMTLLILCLASSAAYLIWHPQFRDRLETLEFQTRLARSLKESAEEARRSGDLARAEIDFNQYLAIVGEDEEVTDDIRELQEQRRAESPSAEPGGNVVSRPRNMDAAQLLDRAIAADERADYSTAHYMATLALAIDPDNAEAARIAAESLAQLESLEPDDEEGETAQLFRDKQRAKRLVTQQNYIEAYNLLFDLSRSHPRDPDVQRYFQIASEQLRAQAVFLDEVQEALSLPGPSDIVFVNQAEPDRTEIVSIGKLVQTPSGIYAQQLDALEFTGAGRPTYRVQSDYAKYSDGHFVLTVVSDETPAQVVEPRVTIGNATRRNHGLLELGPSTEQLLLIAEVFRHPDSASLTVLTRGLRSFEQFGLLMEPLRVELLLRIAFPFTFMAFSLIAVGFAWRFRSRYLHLPPLGTLLVVPVIPLLLLPIYQIFFYGQRLLVTAALLLGGFSLSFILLIVGEALLLLLSLFYVALASRK